MGRRRFARCIVEMGDECEVGHGGGGHHRPLLIDWLIDQMYVSR